MNPLSALFGAGVGIRNRLYDRGSLRINRLQGPVISVGSISAGGAGKTPFVIMLGELLKRRGIAFDVLSRGYGRQTKGVMLVDPSGSPQEFGDEPLLIARKLGVPVIVGEDRYAAGQFAEREIRAASPLARRRLPAPPAGAGLRYRLGHGARLCTIRCCPSEGCGSRLSSLSRASAIVLMDDAAADRIPARKGQFVWRASRRFIAPETRRRLYCILRHRSSAGLLHGAAQGRGRFSRARVNIQTIMRTVRQTHIRCYVCDGRPEPQPSSPQRRTRSIWATTCLSCIRFMWCGSTCSSILRRAGGDRRTSTHRPMKLLYRVITRRNENRVRE